MIFSIEGKGMSKDKVAGKNLHLAPLIAGIVSVDFAKRPTLRMKLGQETLAFDDTGGQGPLVIAVPGMGDLRGEYRYLTPYLVAAGYRVVTVDVRGHGESSAAWDDYSAHAVGKDILALLSQLGQEKAILIGNSFSAGSALWAAHDTPAKVSAMVLIGPIVRDPPEGIPWYVRAALSVGLGGPWRVPFWLTYWTSLFPSGKPVDFSFYRKELGNNLREAGRMTALRTMISLSKADTEAILIKSDTPVFIVMGTKDADFPNAIAEAEWLKDKLGAELLMVTNAGHYPQTEMPEQVGAAIVSFLKAGSF
jgi:pimeloyl-ACP methyl ester carboxylesterase